MIERHVTFSVLPGREKEFEDLFLNHYRAAMANTPGFIRAELLRQREDLSKYQMVLRFETLAAAAAWRQSEAHQVLRPKLKALYGESVLRVYDVVG
jgi:heme-degrading monooxygenase HmoA